MWQKVLKVVTSFYVMELHIKSLGVWDNAVVKPWRNKLASMVKQIEEIIMRKQKLNKKNNVLKDISIGIETIMRLCLCILLEQKNCVTCFNINSNNNCVLFIFNKLTQRYKEKPIGCFFVFVFVFLMIFFLKWVLYLVKSTVCYQLGYLHLAASCTD